MRHEPSFLKDILSACQKIEAIAAATSEDLFLKDEVLTAAVLHHLTVIGEAISRLSVELRERHPEVPWRQIIAVRHRIVHAYFDLDWQILWDAAIGDIPELRRQVLNILTTEFPPGWNRLNDRCLVPWLHQPLGTSAGQLGIQHRDSQDLPSEPGSTGLLKR